MDKINMILEIPSLRVAYEMQVPTYMPIGALIPLLAEAVTGMSNHIYQSSGQEFLCSADHICVMSDDKTLRAYKIKNGDHLVLI